MTSKATTARPMPTVGPTTMRQLGAHPLGAVLTAAAAGWIALPDELGAALAALAACEQAHEQPDQPDPDATRAELVDATAAAFRDGKPLPIAARFHEVDTAARANSERRRILGQVHEQLVADAAAAFAREPILVERVRPALLAVVDQARELAAEHGELLGVDPAALMTDADVRPETHDAWREFGRLVTGYAALRGTADALAGPAGRDPDGLFAEWREAPSDPRLWGPSWAGRNMRPAWTPWPTEPRARLMWLARSGLTVWVPTAAERDARHLEEYPPRPALSAFGRTIVGGAA